MTDSPLQALETKPTSITGTVIHGNAWGRVIGFPTANIEVPGLMAHTGIWTAIVHGAELPAGGVLAAVSVGTRPTYYADAGHPLLEAHLVDFTGDLYGQELSVELRLFLRAEVAFVDTPALVDQLAIDVQNTRDWYAAEARSAS
ncbi:riboflavin kinase [Cryobacterium sp. 1639]|uniref:riboflavin kinase n=1 Tax=Cryobacterium inferilacus TaxID=2866629 RepID=UPI001C72CDC7|nr:riboflavin kinase [Cryobacterium sp. 1639]MBX0300219.1 riboflavin kinase [Cryobacterium sp. 1639]